ncbi:LpqB family beta-propeller domain-containing protein [Geodermatophilus nigrescens]|uniref:Sporulation and spore germination n=1 Tax=Geodermatophilus nigrescens TaxID=1070870 RepID=A0A1M5ND77_9ACTN|nr:LpqB family beta-propeller domain-containing protein [Geodermatophilus nigrescens]SHG87566.1 Sporulation and spore germination [Geodermatophilus nigrescens]
MTRRRAVLAALVLGLLTACSTVPTGSPPVQITEAPTRPAGEVGIEPVGPAAGASPEEIVRGFVDAAASSVQRHPVARDHLTPEAAASWSDESGITLVGADYATVTVEEGTVALTGDLVGTVDPRGVFEASAGQPFTHEFTLTEVGGQWRIANPPDGLVMLVPDFERLYDDLAAYFVDPTGQRVVPDRRYLLGGGAQPTTLVQRLLDGPSPALSAGVGNALSGVTLTRAVTVSGATVTVDLAGLDDLPAPQLSTLCAQLVWTLDQLDGVSSVEITSGGDPLPLDGVPTVQRTDDWAGSSPDSVPADAAGHYLDGGRLMTVDGRPAPGPAGEGAYGLASAAVAADARTSALTSMVGVSVSGGTATFLAGEYGRELAPVFTAGRLSVPTVAATRPEYWVVRDETTVVRVPAGGSPQPVNAPTLPQQGRATALQLSPDGVRAALVVGAADGSSLLVGTVVRSDDGPVALRDLREIAPSLTGVTDVAWRDAGTLVVLAAAGGEDGTVPYEVGVDGWGLTEVPTAGLPSQPTAVAAAPGQQPLVSAGGSVWVLAGGTWVTLVRGQQPVPGIEPFYPV